MPINTSRRTFLKNGAMATLAAAGGVLGPAPDAEAAQARVPTAQDTLGLLKTGKRVPVILDTDIGDDIDDTWALTMMVKSPELDVKLVVGDNANAIYRAKIIAKMLEACGRTDVPVGVGIGRQDRPGRQSAWVGDYDLSRYPGKVHQDGVDAIIKTVHASPDPISLICVGPVPNIGEALKRDPGMARRARFVGMHGSVRRGYNGSSKISPEYNVRANPKALQAVFAAPWEITITPLDTCGIVRLKDEKFQKVYRSKDPGTQALMANYRAWRKKPTGPIAASSTLFDTVAVYLAFSEELVQMEEVPLRVTDDGYTRIDRKARMARCAVQWKDLGAFEDLLVERVTSAG